MNFKTIAITDHGQDIKEYGIDIETLKNERRRNKTFQRKI